MLHVAFSESKVRIPAARDDPVRVSRMDYLLTLRTPMCLLG
jgi:hypothetical protein